MNLSAEDRAEVPASVVTVTSTVPADSAGAVAVIEVAEFAVMVPAVVPNLTPEADERLVPVIETLVPPATRAAGRVDRGHRGWGDIGEPVSRQR